MGFIGTDKSGEDNGSWFPTAPTAPEPEHEDKTSLHDIYWDADGIACCTGGGE